MLGCFVSNINLSDQERCPIYYMKVSTTFISYAITLLLRDIQLGLFLPLIYRAFNNSESKKRLLFIGVSSYGCIAR